MGANYGQRLLVTTLEEKSRSQPQQAFCLLPRSVNLQEGFYEVTYKQIQMAVDYTTQRLQNNLGPFSPNETIAYMGLPDLRYNIFFYAAIKFHLKVFLPSFRNPPTTNASLFEQTQCTKLCYSADSPGIVASCGAVLKVAKALRSFEFLSLDELLSAQCEPVPYLGDFAHRHLAFFGVDRNTKSVVLTNGSIACTDNDRNFPAVSGRRNLDLTMWDFLPGSYIYVSFPPFHMGGFTFSTMVPIFTNTVPIFGLATRIPSGGLVAQILRCLNVSGCLLPPNIVADLYNEPDGPKLLKRLS